MAATTTVSQENHNGEVCRGDIQEAIAKVVELRTIHAALMQGSSPSNLRFPADSPASHHLSHFSAHDYPVFTPSYEDEPLPGYKQLQMDDRNFAESWDDENGLAGGGGDMNGGDISILSDNERANASSRKGFPFEYNLETHLCPAEDQKSAMGSCTANHITVLRASPGTDFSKSRRNSLGDFKSLSSCNKCRPPVISTHRHFAKSSKFSVPLTDSHSSLKSQQPRNRGLNFSWLFPRLKKKHKNGDSPIQPESEEVPHIFKDMGILSVETLKKKLFEANESKEAALMEASEVRSSMGELKHKLEYLETYCEELKNALSKATQAKEGHKRGKSIDENLMPVSNEAMVEGFLQIVSEARLSMKQFCKTLVGQIEETDSNLTESLNALLEPFKLSLNLRYSKAVIYHLEAIINQAFYQDFENCVFQKNGTPKLLDPQQHRQSQFSSFVALRNLSWNEVLRKGTKYYSEEFSKFCDQKMSCIIATLNWTRPWPEQLLQAFFVAAKCLWLLHLLAFSFNPQLGILRVEENRTFDPHFMEDIYVDRQRSNGPARVKIMVMPGFYLQDRVLRCKVLCRYKSVT